ncbi:hypothetical protein N9N28_16730 [Rubripirellula amarantea]|uniref:Uncharacterized protein n=1 Tax=Rubripirellula amarantea TaxID=2527999 RepID=A0A5C5WT88_9BACT|nr:hypothetical protein [Rubripirellula amarantea]MDA8746271.1 hypothetical protein [Rubripirellula amarantea]TWT53365.1 hypothetical protein Pla22_09940 [Rubripirellula amarantea]
MSKYYVQSGTLRTVVSAESTNKAAIWAVHQAMQQVFPIDQDTPTNEPRSVLAREVLISERGFDREDATRFATMQVVSQWNEMVTTLDRLERMLHRAA